MMWWIVGGIIAAVVVGYVLFAQTAIAGIADDRAGYGDDEYPKSDHDG